MKIISGLIGNRLGRMMVSASMSLYLMCFACMFLFYCALLPFFPDFFSALSKFYARNYISNILNYTLILAFSVRIILIAISKIGNLITSSQQHLSLKFNGQPAIISFILPAAEIVFFIFLTYYWKFAVSFDYDESGNVYAQTLVEFLRSKRIALAWIAGFIALAFAFVRGIPESLHTLGFVARPGRNIPCYVWRTLATLCVLVAGLSIYYCTGTDLLLYVEEDPMVIIR